MELSGSVAGIINLLGGGSDVTITPLILEGVRIAKITVDDNDFYIYAPEGGSDISVTPTLQSGTKIGDITIGENTVSLYAPNPTSVSVSQEITQGTLIGSITINDVTTNLFVPSNGGVNYSTEERAIGMWVDGKTLYQRTLVIHNETIINSNRTIANISTDHQVKHFKAIAIELGVTYCIPYIAGSGNASISFRNTGEVDFNILNTSFSAGSDFYITYEYTKVSDVATN